MEELKVSLENIIPLTYARDHFSQIVSEVQRDKLYVLTKGGVPAVAIMDVKYLETITGGGIKKEEIQEEIKKAPEQVGLPKMVEHKQEIRDEKPASPAGGLEMRDKKPTPITMPPTTSPTPPSPTMPAPIATSPPPAGFAAPKPPPPQTSSPPPVAPSSTPSATPKMPEKPSTPPPPSPGKQATNLQFPQENKTDDQSKIDIQFSPDEMTLDKNAQANKTPDKNASPDDKSTPAQYASETDKEPEDMAID